MLNSPFKTTIYFFIIFLIILQVHITWRGNIHVYRDPVEPADRQKTNNFSSRHTVKDSNTTTHYYPHYITAQESTQQCWCYTTPTLTHTHPQYSSLQMLLITSVTLVATWLGLALSNFSRVGTIYIYVSIPFIFSWKCEFILSA